MKIQTYLESLGKAEYEVAANLRKDGIRGVKGSSTACPIIRGIRKNCSENPFVIHLKAYAAGVLTWDDIQVLDPFCPLPVRMFMVNFDTGKYPKLEE